MSSAFATAIGTPITANAADNAPAATESRAVRDIAAPDVVMPIACLFSCGVGSCVALVAPVSSNNGEVCRGSAGPTRSPIRRADDRVMAANQEPPSQLTAVNHTRRGKARTGNDHFPDDMVEAWQWWINRQREKPSGYRLVNV
jgi:hypothetical protein